jgi:arylsulfatase A-like enzyme
MKLVASILLGLLTLAPGALAAAPNLVAIVTDDQAAWTVGCYGGREIGTPNLDRLAAQSTRFANAFVHTPVCSPSRGTYMTGLLGTQLGFTDWLNDGQSQSQGVTPATPTWPSVLAAHGYATCLVGKWHLGMRDESLPWRNGISEFTGNLGGGWQPNKVHFITEKGEKLAPPGFSVEICTELAMKFLDEHKDKPFALLVHFREPHAPYVPMPELDVETSRKADIHVPDYPRLKQPYTADARRNYYASIAAVDRNVGRLLDHLQQSGLADRTVVTFTSDHGYNIGEHGIQHKGNGCWITEDRFQNPRPNMFDTSLRVPLLIRCPGAGKPGAVVEEWVTNADMFATVLGLLGVDKPSKMPAASRDYSAAVRGEQLPAAAFPQELFGQYDLVNNPTKRHMRMIRTDRWKLVLHLNAPSENELYDLAADPGERTNAFGRPDTAETVGELTKRIRRHMAAIDDPRLNEVP